MAVPDLLRLFFRRGKWKESNFGALYQDVDALTSTFDITSQELSRYVILDEAEDAGREVGFGVLLHTRAAARSPLAVHLTLHSLDQLVKELVPFYGIDCPISVLVERGVPERQVVRATLGTVEYRTAEMPVLRSTLVLVG